MFRGQKVVIANAAGTVKRDEVLVLTADDNEPETEELFKNNSKLKFKKPKKDKQWQMTE